MLSKWLKPLILLVLVVTLLTVAVATSLKVGDSSDSVSPSSDSPVPDSSETVEPTAAPVTNRTGWVSENGNMYYYLDGVLQKDTIVGNDTDGYSYVNADGIKDFGYCNGVTIDGVDWNIIEGNATRVEDEWDAALHSACKDIGKCTNSSMTKEQKLRVAFDYIKSDDNYLEGVRHDPPYNDLDWPVVCANDLFEYGRGDCFSYGAAFAFYGKACGFDNCYACNSGGHGWAEIDGKAYDPEWDMHHNEYNHFGVSPEDDCDVAYFTTLTEGVDWMYMQV